MVKTVPVSWSLLDRAPLFRAEKFKKRGKVKAFIQARTGSTRLPGKIYKDINGAPMLFHTINMAKRAKLIDEVIVVSPQRLAELPENIPEFVYDGDETDLLSRYVAALDAHPCDYVVRLTSDCPLLDFYLIDFVIAASIGADYGSNVLAATFPDGMDVEVIEANTLREIDRLTTDPRSREHVTTILRNDPEIQVRFNLVSVQAYVDQSCVKLSVDTEEDLHRVREMEKSFTCQK